MPSQWKKGIAIGVLVGPPLHSPYLRILQHPTDTKVNDLVKSYKHETVLFNTLKDRTLLTQMNSNTTKIQKAGAKLSLHRQVYSTACEYAPGHLVFKGAVGFQLRHNKANGIASV